MGAVIKRVYWDACTFLGLINDEAGKISGSRSVWDSAVAGETEIVTSFFTMAEVFKAKCEGKIRPLDADGEDRISAFFTSDHIVGVPVDRRTGELARKLMRAHSECSKPTDSVHLATAIYLNVDEMHTFDGADLLKLSGKVARADGEMLTICQPYVNDPQFPLIGGSGIGE